MFIVKITYIGDMMQITEWETRQKNAKLVTGVVYVMAGHDERGSPQHSTQKDSPSCSIKAVPRSCMDNFDGISKQLQKSPMLQESLLSSVLGTSKLSK